MAELTNRRDWANGMTDAELEAFMQEIRKAYQIEKSLEPVKDIGQIEIEPASDRAKKLEVKHGG